MAQAIKRKFRNRPVSHFIKLYKPGRLNLNPGFQRKSVWSEKDRRKFIHSIFDGFPVPSIFLYRRINERGVEVFDVLDGKQRLEAIFAFCRLKGFSRQGFGVRHRFTGVPNEDDKSFWWIWKSLKYWNRQNFLLNYIFQVVEADAG